MPGSNFYNALANARQQTEKLKQQKLAEINAASGALANERSRADDRKAKQQQFDQELAFNREKMGFDAANRDKQFANALEIATIGAGTRKDIAGQGNLTKKEIEEMKQRGAGERNTLTNDTRQYIAGETQRGATERNDANRTTRESEGALTREHQKAMQERGLTSVESRTADQIASRERMAAHRDELASARDAALQKHREAQLAWQQSSGSMKQAWKEQMDRARMEHDSIMGQLKAAEAVLATPEQKEEISGKLKALPGSLRGSGVKPAPQPQYAPGQDVTETGTPADMNEMEPLAKSMANDVPFGVAQSDRNPAPSAPVPPSDSVAPMPVQPSKSATPNSKEARVARLNEIAIQLAKADKANGLSKEEILAKNAAGEYDNAAREQFNAEGLKTAQSKNNAVTGKPVESVGYEDEMDKAMGIAGLPGRGLQYNIDALGTMAKGLGHTAAGAVDTVTGVPIEMMKSGMGTIANNTPGVSEKSKADFLSKLAGLRGTKFSSLNGYATQSEARSAGNQEAALEAAALVLPKVIGTGASKAAPYLSKIPGVKAAGEAISGLLSKGGSKASRTAAEAAEAQRVAAEEAKASAHWGKPMNYSGAADEGASDFAKAIRGEVDDAAMARQKELELAALEPQMPNVAPTVRMPHAPQAPVVQVDPETGIKMIVIETPQGPKTLPISSFADDAMVPPELPAGQVGMVGPQASEIKRAAPMYQNPANYPDPMAYDAATPSFSQALTKSSAAPLPPTKPIDFGMGTPPKPGGVNQRHAVLKEQVQGEKDMDMYRAMKDTYVPSGAPEQPGLRAFAKEEMDAAFAPGSMVGSTEAGANIAVSPAMQAAAADMGIPAQGLFELMHSIPIGQLPKGIDMTTPEGAKIMVRAIRNYANNQGYRGMTGGL